MPATPTSRNAALEVTSRKLATPSMVRESAKSW